MLPPRTSNLTVPLDLQQLFPFPLDDFQQAAIDALNCFQSVVVSAPTGSGKTLIGEYAIYRGLDSGQRVFYTTPLKALSNQKFRDFSEQFGPDKVGLLTGDICINRDAPVIVMTTEIFRNMLYGTSIGDASTSKDAIQNVLKTVQAVILDECHYMNDQQRGTVWEESIIYCPARIQLVALSATIANAHQLADWMKRVHGPTCLIESSHRPVPLNFHFGTSKGIFPLLHTTEAGKRTCNPRLKTKRPEGKRHSHIPDVVQIVDILNHRDMLPAIYFIFSRKGCDDAIRQMGSVNLVTSEKEQAHLHYQIERFCQESPEAIRQGQLDPLCRGIAAHHAGMLPAWKNLVETLFQQGLVKVVFATETLAAGINMPARTTVISSLSKRTDNGHRLLTASEFMQMSGRAGRRGKDIIGYVVPLQSPFEGATEAARLATSGADPLVSQFTPNYGMVLNLLQKHSLEDAQELVNRSFGQYLISLQNIPQQKEVEELQAEIVKLDHLLNGLTEEQINHYEKLQGKRQEERRSLRYLEKQLKQEKDSTLVLLGQQHLRDQIDRIKTLESQILSHPVHAKAGKNIAQLLEQRQKLQKRLEKYEEDSLPLQQKTRWTQFMSLVDVLKEFDCLNGFDPTETGEVVAAIRGDNELWLAQSILSGELHGLSPEELAGALAAIVTEPPRSGPVSQLRASGAVEDALDSLRRIRRHLFRSQRQHHVFHMPVWLDANLSGLVEQWAAGIEWETLESSTNLDSGDLVRLIRRTLDFLWQIPHIPHLEGHLKDTAREARLLLDRFPVSEVI